MVKNTVFYSRMEELPADVDLVDFVVPKDETFEVLKEAVELGRTQAFGKRSQDYLDIRSHLKYTAKMNET